MVRDAKAEPLLLEESKCLLLLQDIADNLSKHSDKFKTMPRAAWRHQNSLILRVDPVDYEILASCNSVVTLLDLLYPSEFISKYLYCLLPNLFLKFLSTETLVFSIVHPYFEPILFEVRHKEVFSIYFVIVAESGKLPNFIIRHILQLEISDVLFDYFCQTF